MRSGSCKHDPSVMSCITTLRSPVKRVTSALITSADPSVVYRYQSTERRIAAHRLSPLAAAAGVSSANAPNCWSGLQSDDTNRLRVLFAGGDMMVVLAAASAVAPELLPSFRIWVEKAAAVIVVATGGGGGDGGGSENTQGMKTSARAQNTPQRHRTVHRVPHTTPYTV